MTNPRHNPQQRGDEGFMLVAVIVMIFIVLLVLSVAAPRIATQLKRDREVESAHRANQYVRALSVYYRKFGHYPGTLEQLQKSNNQRFLRADYIDPLTGKNDWRLIHLGENKTTVKGLFGEDLPGLPAGGAGGLSTPSSTLTTSPSTPGGGTGTPGQTPGSTTPGQTPGSGSLGSLSVSDLKGSGGLIMGVGSAKSGNAIVVVNEQTSYQDWEFLYDPRVEQLKAKWSLFGGGLATAGTSTGTSNPPPPSLSKANQSAGQHYATNES